MHNIWMILRQVLARLAARDGAAADPLAQLSARELADLPPFHPRCEDCAG